MKFVIQEAGGGAARSAYYFFRDAGVHIDSLLAVDSNPKALVEWERILQVKTQLQEQYNYKEGDVISPNDEYFRLFNSTDGLLCNSKSLEIHHKAICYEKLASSSIDNLKLPKRMRKTNGLQKYVVRNVLAAGLKGLIIGTQEFQENKDIIITEYIPFEYELVVDFYSLADFSQFVMAPRITHNMNRIGEDMFCTLIGVKNKEYRKICDMTEAVIKTLGIQKIGMLQLGFLEGRYYFIEAATRLSGSSYLNLASNYNPIKAILHGRMEYNNDFENKYISTRYFKPFNVF